ncbi:response regulator [Paenibacillus sp. J5C_2022]|uniref:response regulator n=1 Tax=Paenibacillus sp. J5C2022 TaxID=2977129 RepID=UPI0021D2202B|nr:response regulator [Paenibacillus sp. J5C2022]MCU6707899.1 response regulator [Paenibacillus sp. J5C2022]
MKLKAMLVDDELPILNNLTVVLPWEELGFQLVALARNGQEAMERYRESEPDLILCDIRMPVMDGMKVLSEVRKLGKPCEIVMLTGYQDFEYTRTAIQHGVRDYILKPIDYEHLERTVRKLGEEIRYRKQEAQLAEERWRQLTRIAYEKMLYDTLLGISSQSASYMPGDEQALSEGGRYSMLLVDIDHYAQLSMSWNHADRKQWNCDIRKVLEKALRKKALGDGVIAVDGDNQLRHWSGHHAGTADSVDHHYTVLQLREGEWCILIGHADGERWTNGEAEQWKSCIQEAVGGNNGLSVSVVFHRQAMPLSELASTYKHLQLLVLQQGSDALTELQADRTDGDAADRDGVKGLWHALDAVLSALRQLDQPGMKRALQQLQSRYLSGPEAGFDRGEKLVHYMLIHLLREMREMDILAAEEEEDVWQRLQHSVGVNDVMEVILQLVDGAMEKAFSKRSSELLMLSAKEYIHSRLSSDLGVDELAGHLGISGSYFSMLFKSHFGETFVEYVTRQRMELAQRMLLTTDKTVTEIGTQAGYSERRYFTKVFHKHTRMTPSEYREHHVSNKTKV